MIDVAAAVERVVAEAPPLTDEQRDRIGFLLHGRNQPYTPPEEPTERELARARLTAEAKRIAEEVQACVICGVPIFVHPKVRGHEWEPNPLAIAKYRGSAQ